MKKIIKIFLFITFPIWLWPVWGFELILDIFKMVWRDICNFIDKL